MWKDLLSHPHTVPALRGNLPFSSVTPHCWQSGQWMGGQGMGKPWVCPIPVGTWGAGLKVAHEASVKVGGPLIPMLFSAQLRRLLSPRSCHAPHSSCPCILSPLRQNQYLYSLPLTPAPKTPIRSPSLLLSSGERKRGVDWGGVGGSGPPLPSPAPRPASIGLARGGGPIFAPSIPPSLYMEPPASWAWGLAPDLGPAELAPALGSEPVTPSCAWTFPPWGA